MVTTEAVPFAKSGGLGDAVSALAQELDRSGHDVRVLMPRYYGIRRDHLFKLPSPFRVKFADEIVDCAIYEGRLPDSEVVVYFLEHEALFGRDGIYGHGGTAFGDNLRRFTVLSHAALAIGSRIGWDPEILHVHDWPTALVPAFANVLTGANRPATLLTIHNLGYQGKYPVSMLPETGLSWSQLVSSGLLHGDELNMLRAGVVGADYVTTVSPTYAKEIQTPLYGFGLDEDLRTRKKTFAGILNGVDYALWNPEVDHHLELNYTTETVELKKRIKASLQAEVGLQVNDKIPLFGMVTRLVSQKGLEELIAPGYGALPGILADQSVQFVILGTGSENYEYELRQLAKRYKNLSVMVMFDEGTAHRIEAGADFFLMPSRYEPCGLNQLYSLRYGTIPVVTNTGGLADTVVPMSEEGGTGFLIEEPNPPSISRAVAEAVRVYGSHQNRIVQLRQEGMKQRFGWNTAAKEYAKLYGKVIAARASARGGSSDT